MCALNNRSKSQFNTYDAAVRKVLEGIFSEKLLPADRVLADFYRSRRNCGSNDRKFINNGIYSLLRCWGWLRAVIPHELLEMIESCVAGLFLHYLDTMYMPKSNAGFTE